jgi:hypothetical protein
MIVTHFLHNFIDSFETLIKNGSQEEKAVDITYWKRVIQIWDQHTRNKPCAVHLFVEGKVEEINEEN